MLYSASSDETTSLGNAANKIDIAFWELAGGLVMLAWWAVDVTKSSSLLPNRAVVGLMFALVIASLFDI